MGYISKDYWKVLNDAIQNGDVEIDGYDIVDKAIRMDKIVVTTFGGKVILNLDYTCNTEYKTLWKSDVGGILVKDIKKSVFDNYYVFSAKGMIRKKEADMTAAIRVLARRVTPDIQELVVSEPTKYFVVKFGDYEYLMMKVVPLSETSFGGRDTSLNTCLVDTDDTLPEFEGAYTSEVEESDEPLYIDESMDTTYNFFNEDE